MNKYAMFSKQHEASLWLEERIHNKNALACSKKRGFNSEIAAVNHLREKRLDRKIYLCPNCLHFHTALKSSQTKPRN